MDVQSRDWLVDLSYPIKEGYGELPGHPPTKITSIHTHAEHGRSNAYLSMSIHVATHVDAPYHFYANGRSIDKEPLNKFCGPAVLLDLRSKCQPNYGFTAADLEESMTITGLREISGLRVLLHSGWAKNYGSREYYTINPYLTPAAATWLVQKGVNLVGLDFPPDSRGGVDPTVHQILLREDVCILENLVNIEQIPDTIFELICLPIKIAGAGGAPARALARSLKGDLDE